MNITPTKIASATNYNIATKTPLAALCLLFELESVQADHLILTHGSSDNEAAALVIARGPSAAILRSALSLRLLKKAASLTLARDCLALDLGQGPHVKEALHEILFVLARPQVSFGGRIQILPQGRTMWRLVYRERVVGFASSYPLACTRADELEATLRQAA